MRTTTIVLELGWDGRFGLTFFCEHGAQLVGIGVAEAPTIARGEAAKRQLEGLTQLPGNRRSTATGGRATGRGWPS